MPVLNDSKSEPKKIQQSWADQMAEEDDAFDVIEELPPTQEIVKGDTKTVISYKYNDDGKKVKTVSYYRIEKRQVSKSIATRKNWKKFGLSRKDPPGPNPADTFFSDEIFMQFISNRDDDHLDANRNEGNVDNLKNQTTIGLRSTVKCRYCEQDHWTSKCPYKDKFEMKGTLKDKEAAVTTSVELKVDEGKKTGKYVPPSMREGGNKRGDVMTSGLKSKDEPNTIRVTNLPEEIQDSDIRDLFMPFGRVVRIFLAKDKYTGQSKGFAFVSFERKEDAAKAIKAVNGFGYSNLILSVEWAKPSNN